MNIQNIEKKEKNMATFEVKVPADVFDNAVNEVYKKNKSQLYVAGFRKGKAPRAVIEGMYGKDVFYPEAIETLAQEAFEAGRAECGFECVGAPSLLDQKINDDKELIYTFEVAVYPEVVLGQYKGLEVPQNHETFDESKVDEEMLTFRSATPACSMLSAGESGRPRDDRFRRLHRRRAVRRRHGRGL
ncbi:MAG: trigger factor family protein [Oscillospiraceae bacterium]